MKNILIFIVLAAFGLITACQSEQSAQQQANPYPAPAYKVQASLKPFYQGVASGDPQSNSVVIWTRVTPEFKGPVSLDWQLATDESMSNVIREGNAEVDSTSDYTLQLLVEDLNPQTHYYYQFKALDSTSIIGRTKTAPEDEAKLLNFAFASCSNYEAGFFNAYARIAEIDSLDAVFHLGDYIYEYAAGVYGDSTTGRFHQPPHEIVSLQDYRTRYAQYRSDPDLIKAHQMHPFITIWDDHEISNNAYVEGAENHQPSDEGDWNARKEAARQAYYEWMPVNQEKENELYRKLSYGSMADFFMLDGRLAGRTKQAGNINEADYLDSSRTMLGEAQLTWLLENLDNSTATWKILGNQVVFSGLNVGHFGRGRDKFMDMWDGYPVERARIINHIRDNNIHNFLIVTGDFHSSMGLETYQDPMDFNGYGDPDLNAGVEFVVQSITSSNLDEYMPPDTVNIIKEKYMQPQYNPHIKYANLTDHGYFLLSLDSETALAQWVYVDDILNQNTGQKIKRVLKVNEGESKLQEVSKPPF